MPGPHVCNPSGVLFFFVPRGAVATRRVTEREKERKRRERLPRHRRGGELIQTHIIFFFGPKTSWCQASATGWYTRFPSFLFVYFFIFILPIAIFIDAHGRRRRLVHYTPAAQHTWSASCRMFTLQSKTPLIGRFYFPSVVVFCPLILFRFVYENS